jgi:hypothetical protein
VKIAAIPQVLPSNRTGESVPSKPAGKFSGAFLWRPHAQSGFSDSIRRMQYDNKPMMRRKRLDFPQPLAVAESKDLRHELELFTRRSAN